jgi:L,D-transpeptidase ErfK/SrfK
LVVEIAVINLLFFKRLIFISLFLGHAAAFALSMPKPVGEDTTIGRLRTVKVQTGDDFYRIARRYDVGFFELVEANPGIDPDSPLLNAVVIIPTRYVLPNVPHRGIVVNLAEMRLYYFPRHQTRVYTYPVGVGQLNWATPEGDLHIIQKMKNPIWIVPDSIRRYRQKRGDPVPKIVKAGPDNPLGQFAMRLSNPVYLIHGTNEPEGVGQRSSAGCIRLYPEDIAELFSMVPKGTPVKIINDPMKFGLSQGAVVMEAHQPFKEQQAQYPRDGSYVAGLLAKFLTGKTVSVDAQLAKSVALAQTGMPTKIG